MASRWSKLCLPLAMVCSLFLFPAGALAVEWNSDNIDEVKAELDELVTKVRDLFQRIRHNIPHPPPSGNATNIVTKILEIESNLNGQEAGTVLKELKQQFAELNAQGELIREGVGDMLGSFAPRLQDYRTFVGLPGEKCGTGTPCSDMREEIVAFLDDFSKLAEKFPVIAAIGLDDTSQDLERIMNAPPLLLFYLNEPWQKIKPLLDRMSEDLEGVFAAMGDPDLFTIDFARSALPGESAALKAAGWSVHAQSRGILGGPSSQFCERMREGRRQGAVVDPIRINRIRLLLAVIINALNFVSDVEFGVCVDVAGEGTCAPAKSRAVNRLRLVRFVVESIDAAIETRRANLEVCGL